MHHSVSLSINENYCFVRDPLLPIIIDYNIGTSIFNNTIICHHLVMCNIIIMEKKISIGSSDYYVMSINIINN